MPLDATATRASAADRGRNPIQGYALGAGTTAVNSGHIAVQLMFQGVQGKAEDIFDALETKYGAGKVTTDRDSLAGNRLQFRIKP